MDGKLWRRQFRLKLSHGPQQSQIQNIQIFHHWMPVSVGVYICGFAPWCAVMMNHVTTPGSKLKIGITTDNDIDPATLVKPSLHA